MFAFCFCAFAQTSETSPCPTISVTGPSGIPMPNESINFSASVDNKGNDSEIKYVWSVSHGKIVEGQGTQNIKVILAPSDGSLTVTVEVKGFPTNCPNTASESLSPDCSPQAEKIEEVSEPIAQIEKNRIAEIVRALQNDPNAQLYIIFRHKENTSSKLISQKEREISNSLIKTGLAGDRITTVTDFGKSESVKFWLVPAGANPPTVEDN